jgi:DNA-binding CsgD family transcriptional regulator
MLQSLDARLTERERQVCAHALSGVTVAGIASMLGVKESTVATLRRRAYTKLGISNLNSLFALCVAQLGGSKLTR